MKISQSNIVRKAVRVGNVVLGGDEHGRPILFFYDEDTGTYHPAKPEDAKEIIGYLKRIVEAIEG